jgi:hypothetical protein
MLELAPKIRLFLLLLLLASVGLVGCSDADLSARAGATPEFYAGDPAVNDDEGDEVGNDDDDDDAAPTSGVQLISTQPAAGSSDHLYRSPIWLEFSGYAGSASVSLLDSDSYSVPSQLVWNDEVTSCQLKPTEALRPDSPYRVVVELGDTMLEFQFRTSLLGSLVEPAEVDGRSYALDFSEVVSSDAPVLAAVMQASNSVASWMVQPAVDAGGSMEVDIAFAVASSAGFEQSDCAFTTGTGVTDDGSGELEPDGSYFVVAGDLLALPLDDRELLFENWMLDGDFIPGGDALGAVAFAGDLRADSLGLESEGAACALAEAEMGSSCEPCSVDSSMFCIPVSLTDISGEPVVENIVPQPDGQDLECGDESSGLLTCSLASEDRSRSSLAMLFLLGLLLRSRRRS